MGEPFAAWIPRDVMTVSGPDTVAFLQGQLSQDVEALAEGTSAYSLLLKPEGKVDAWLRVTRTGPASVVLDLEGGWGERALARLSRFKLRTRCELGLAGGWRCLAVRGTAAVDPSGCGATLSAPAGWPVGEGMDLLGPDVVVPPGIAEADEATYHRARIEAGVPRLGAELDESTIPAEAGRWFVDASASFTKGCYTGQELVARVDSRGSNTPRRLRAVRIAAGEGGHHGLRAGTVLRLDGAEVGRVTSAADAVGLAYLKRSVIPPAVVSVDGAPAGLDVEVAELPGSA